MRARSAGENRVGTVANTAAVMAPPPRPCSARAPISCVKSCACAHRTDVTRKAAADDQERLATELI
jgi:hypothetical protein